MRHTIGVGTSFDWGGRVNFHHWICLSATPVTTDVRRLLLIHQQLFLLRVLHGQRQTRAMCLCSEIFLIAKILGADRLWAHKAPLATAMFHSARWLVKYAGLHQFRLSEIRPGRPDLARYGTWFIASATMQRALVKCWLSTVCKHWQRCTKRLFQSSNTKFKLPQERGAKTNFHEL